MEWNVRFCQKNFQGNPCRLLLLDDSQHYRHRTCQSMLFSWADCVSDFSEGVETSLSESFGTS